MAGIDPNILLSGQVPQFPNPLALATQGLSLADLANRNQLMQYQLQTQQQYGQAVQQLGNAQAQGQDPSTVLPQIAQQYPLAYAKILSDQKQLELTKAQITEATGKGAEASANAFKTGNQILSNAASAIAQRGTPPTPFEMQYLTSQALHAAALGGIDPRTLNIPAPDSDPGQQLAWAQAVSSGGMLPKDAADIALIYKGTLPKTVADTQKTQAEIPWVAPQAQANIAAKQAEAANIYAPRVEISPFGQQTVLQRFPTPAIYTPGNTAPGAQPQLTPTGTPGGLTLDQNLSPQDRAAAQADFARTGGVPQPGSAPAVGAPGGPVAAPGTASAQAIADYKAAPPATGRANPFGAMLMDQVDAINKARGTPPYDASLWEARQKNIDNFSSGPNSAVVRANNAVTTHMELLQQLGQALQNGNQPQVVNAIQNRLSQEFGGTPVTSFNAAAGLVGKELAKAYVAGGGGEGEREGIISTFSNAQSYPQIAGTIDTYQKLLGGQLNSLKTQYDANNDPLKTGASDFGKYLVPQSAALLTKFQQAQVTGGGQPAAPAGPMTPAKRDALVKGALDAISQGKDPAAVRARLQQLGVTDARI